jgi:hypothetical protein
VINLPVVITVVSLTKGAGLRVADAPLFDQIARFLSQWFLGHITSMAQCLISEQSKSSAAASLSLAYNRQ